MVYVITSKERYKHMIGKIKKTIILAAATLMMSLPGTVPALSSIAFAENTGNSIANGVCTGSQPAGGTSDQGVSCSANNNGNIDIGGLARTVVNIFSIIVGAVAVIMIIYGGFRYITSGGDSNSVGAAKNTLIYAIVGLIIVALAQVIVHFVLSTTTNSVGGGSQ
jgi:hypothetical protein